MHSRDKYFRFSRFPRIFFHVRYSRPSWISTWCFLILRIPTSHLFPYVFRHEFSIASNSHIILSHVRHLRLSGIPTYTYPCQEFPHCTFLRQIFSRVTNSHIIYSCAEFSQCHEFQHETFQCQTFPRVPTYTSPYCNRKSHEFPHYKPSCLVFLRVVNFFGMHSHYNHSRLIDSSVMFPHITFLHV